MRGDAGVPYGIMNSTFLISNFRRVLSIVCNLLGMATHHSWTLTFTGRQTVHWDIKYTANPPIPISTYINFPTTTQPTNTLSSPP